MRREEEVCMAKAARWLIAAMLGLAGAAALAQSATPAVASAKPAKFLWMQQVTIAEGKQSPIRR
jgi:hypothetical protein